MTLSVRVLIPVPLPLPPFRVVHQYCLLSSLAPSNHVFLAAGLALITLADPRRAGKDG
jgi:hypothetical protein